MPSICWSTAVVVGSSVTSTDIPGIDRLEDCALRGPALKGAETRSEDTCGGGIRSTSAWRSEIELEE